MQNALVSIVVALRNEPDRHLLIDRMELTPFTTNTIINYNSFLALRRGPPHPQGNEQFASGRVLEMAEKVLNNLQKGIVLYQQLQDWKKEVHILQLIKLYRTMNLHHIYQGILTKRILKSILSSIDQKNFR